MNLTVSTPIGLLTLVEEDGALTEVRFGGCPEAEQGSSPLLQEAAKQLSEYFEGSRKNFTVLISSRGTPFQRRCWDALVQIPYGQTRTYAQQAAMIGQPKACRAVGMANHRNPLPILIPCHRVVGASGALTGYAGGLNVKEYLLNTERMNLN